MGMFDSIICEYPLPVKEVQSRIFQTKDTPDQFLSKYKITKDGKLFVSLGGFYEKESFKKGSCKNEKWKRVCFEGKIRFYDFYNDETQSGWIEFLADFKKGKLVSLKCCRNDG